MRDSRKMESAAGAGVNLAVSHLDCNISKMDTETD